MRLLQKLNVGVLAGVIVGLALAGSYSVAQQIIYGIAGTPAAQIISVQFPLSNAVRGSSGNVTDTSAHQIIAAPSAGLRNYVRSIECGNTGTTSSAVTFNDSATTVINNPSGEGNNLFFDPPLQVALATAFNMTAGLASTNQFCSAQGFTGP